MKDHFNQLVSTPPALTSCNHSFFWRAPALIGTSALLAFSLLSPAHAADIGDWSGFHVGGNIGYGLGDADSKNNRVPENLPVPANNDWTSFSQSVDVDGVLLGGQVGYDWQFDWQLFGATRNIVLGVEADLNWSDMEGSDTKRPIYDGNGTAVPTTYQTVSADLDWLSTVRLRAGFLLRPSWLLYATGGLAIGKVKYSALLDGATPGPLTTAQQIYSGSSSETATGWTLGVGAEWRFNRQWSVKAEHLYFDLGEETINANPQAPNPPWQSRTRFDLKGQILRAGVNYRF